MPIPDLGTRLSWDERRRIAQAKTYARLLARRGGKRPDGEAGESVPMDPDRPFDLSGGAAAALDFGD